MTLTALLGSHDDTVLILAKRAFTREGYEVDSTTTLKGMKEFALEKRYDRYLMDLNLGHSNTKTIEPAQEIYTIVRNYVESGQAKFKGISGREDIVEMGNKAGIPSVDKYMNINTWLKE